MDFLTVLAVCMLSLVAQDCLAYRVTFGPKGSCTTKRGYVIFKMKRFECGTMGGAWNGSPGASDWIDCHTDVCDINRSPVTTGAMWSISAKQTDPNALPTPKTYGIIPMIRKDCDNIRGRYNLNPSESEWIDCHLYFIKQDGSNRQNLIDVLIIGGVGECGNKLAYGSLRTIGRDCTIMNGAVNGSPGATDWTDCHLDICLSPVIDCVPYDAWQTISTCHNPSINDYTCSVSLTSGITNTKSTSSTTGGSVDVSVTQETGVELEGIFSASLSISVTTGFHWSTTTSTSEAFSKSSTHAVEVDLGAGDDVAIQQVVGYCGDFKIGTMSWRVQNI